MASRSVSLLKFVGTVSLGLLTGLSYTLSTLTVPTLFTLPSASAAARAFNSLATSAKTHLRTLTAVSGSAFILAFLLSPRPYRHPYLLYTSLLVVSSRLVTVDLVAQYLFLSKSSSPASNHSASFATTRKQRREGVTRARMEASYEVLGSGSDTHSEGAGSTSGEDLEADGENSQEMNGEEVRTEVEDFLKKQMIQTIASGLGFLMAVVGIWGDSVAQVLHSDAFVVGV